MILGVGTDLVEVGRLERAVARLGEEFLREILTAAEIGRFRRSSRFLPACAAAFAAKEALFKALGTGRTGRLSWHDLEFSDPWRVPRLHLQGATAEQAASGGALRAHVSIAATRRHASAVVVLEGSRPGAERD